MIKIPLESLPPKDYQNFILELKTAYPSIDLIEGRCNAEHEILVLTVKVGNITIKVPTGKRALEDKINRVRRMGEFIMSSVAAETSDQ
jgi:glycerol-3-phosphate responsive antiterminator